MCSSSRARCRSAWWAAQLLPVPRRPDPNRVQRPPVPGSRTPATPRHLRAVRGSPKHGRRYTHPQQSAEHLVTDHVPPKLCSLVAVPGLSTKVRGAAGVIDAALVAQASVGGAAGVVRGSAYGDGASSTRIRSSSMTRAVSRSSAGTAPLPVTLLKEGRAEVTSYGGELIGGTVTDPPRRQCRRRRWSWRGWSPVRGDSLRRPLAAARRVLVTTGLRDELPDIPGVRERCGPRPAALPLLPRLRGPRPTRRGARRHPGGGHDNGWVIIDLVGRTSVGRAGRRERRQSARPGRHRRR